MKLTGINMNDVKHSNRTAVLYLLNREGELSRKDIAQKLGLTPAAVTKICRELLEEKKIIEIGKSDENIKAGRKKILISLNADKLFAIGVSLELDYCNYGIYTVSGKTVLRERIAFDRNKKPEAFLNQISAEINALIKKSRTARKNIIGVGVGIVGAVNSEGITVGKYGLWQEDVRVREIFEKNLKMPVKVDNNIKAFVLAQTLFEKQTQGRNQLFIKWGPGVGSAIMIDSEVFSSNKSGEAEIGHYIVRPNGTPCRCGRKGCLETYVSTGAIINRIKESYSKETTPSLFALTNGKSENINYELLAENREKLDKCILEIIDRRINRMARAAVNAATLFDPDGVVVFGYMFDRYTTQRFIEYCKNYYPKYDENFITVSTLFDKSQYIGAVALALKNMFFEK